MGERKISSAEPAARVRTARGREAPAEVTHAETLYWQRHVEQRTGLVLTLRDGEVLRGVAEWQDRGSVRVNLEQGGHVVLLKHALATVQPTG